MASLAPQLTLRGSALTHLGNVRQRNEDACGILEDAGIAFVADGMGGHAAGDVASRLVAECVRAGFTTDLLSLAQRKLQAHVSSHPEDASLGTTLDAIFLRAGMIEIVHIGDSRIYQITNETLVSITEDHSYVGDLVRAGELTREEARVHPMSNLITKYIGAQTSHQPDFRTISAERGMRFLLATDGMTDMVAETEIERLIGLVPEREALAKVLVEAALQRGGLDNISVVIADVV